MHACETGARTFHDERRTGLVVGPLAWCVASIRAVRTPDVAPPVTGPKLLLYCVGGSTHQRVEVG